MNRQIEYKPIDRPAVSVEEAGEMLGIGRTYAYQLVREGKLRHVKLGKRIIVLTESVYAYLGIEVAPPTYATGEAA